MDYHASENPNLKRFMQTETRSDYDPRTTKRDTMGRVPSHPVLTSTGRNATKKALNKGYRGAHLASCECSGTDDADGDFMRLILVSINGGSDDYVTK